MWHVSICGDVVAKFAEERDAESWAASARSAGKVEVSVTGGPERIRLSALKGDNTPYAHDRREEIARKHEEET